MESLLGSYLKKVRKQKKLTQAEITEGLFDRSYWSQIERGARIPPKDTLALIAKRLDIDIETLELLYPGSEYLTELKLAAHSMKSGPTNPVDAEIRIKKAWETFSRVENTNQMMKCVEVWATFPNVSYALSEAIDFTIYLCNLEDRPLDELWNLLILSGNTHYHLGNFEKALLVYNDILKKKPPEDISVRTHRNLGSTLFWLFRYDDALHHYKKVLGFKSISRDMKAQAHQGVSACLRNLSSGDEALYHCQIALELFKSIDPFHHMQCLHTIGALKLDDLRFGEAITLFKKVQAYYEEHNLNTSLAELFEEYVRYYFYQGDYELANDLATECLYLIDNANPTLAGQLYVWKSWCYLKMEKEVSLCDAYLAARHLLADKFVNTIRYMDPVYNAKWQFDVEEVITRVKN